MVTRDEAIAHLDEMSRQMKKNKTRFAIGRKGAGHSSVWAAWDQGSEFYIAGVSMIGNSKISLHKSGICRIGLHEDAYNDLPKKGLKQPPDRAFTKWRRLPTPDQGAVHVLSLIFPTDFLRLQEPTYNRKKPVLIMEAAPAGSAVQVGFFYSKENGKPMEEKLLQVGHPLFYFALKNGETVWLVAKAIPFDSSSLPSGPLGMSPDGVLDPAAIPAPGTEKKNLTAIFWNSPKDGDPFYIWEVGGGTISGPVTSPLSDAQPASQSS